MSLEDKAKNATTDVVGKAKEGVGDLAGDDQLKTEGEVDQAKTSAATKAEEEKTRQPRRLAKLPTRLKVSSTVSRSKNRRANTETPAVSGLHISFLCGLTQQTITSRFV